MPHFPRNTQICTVLNENRLHMITVGFGRTHSSWGSEHSFRAFSEISIVTDGSATICANGETFEIGQGKAFLIPPGLEISYRNTDPAHPVEKIFIFFKISASDGADVLTGFPTVGITELPPERVEEAVRLFRQGKNGADAIRFAGLIYDILAAVLEKQVFVPEKRDYSKPVLTMLRVIRESSSVTLTVPEVAAAVRLSPSRATALFHKEVGFRLREYIRTNALRASQKDLLRGEMTIGKISEKYGFCDQFHYSRAFKETFEMTPSDFRKNYSGNL